MTLEIKPCPFCGHKDAPNVYWSSECEWEFDESNEDTCAVICDASTDNNKGGCGASSGFGNLDHFSAIQKWNKRAVIGD